MDEEIIIEKKQLKSTKEKHSQKYIITNSLYTDGIKNNVPVDILNKLIKLWGNVLFKILGPNGWYISYFNSIFSLIQPSLFYLSTHE